MQPIVEQYRFEKFWKLFTQADRGVSKWDDTRTDMDVFVRRTLMRWFAGKYFQVQQAIYEGDWCSNDYYVSKFTTYVYVTHIRFAYQWADKIVICYVEPNSRKIEEVIFGHNDFIHLDIIENETDFAILRKFYPISKVHIPKPDFSKQLK